VQGPDGVEVQDEHIGIDELDGRDDPDHHLDQKEQDREGVEVLRYLLALSIVIVSPPLFQRQHISG
jgi:hypothetical protein